MTNRCPRLLVLAGGALGTGARYACFQIWFHVRGTFPVTTLVVNALGAFALGLLLATTASHPRARDLRLLVGAGFLGGFTTFSAFTVELAEYRIDGDPATGLIYAAAMVAAGLAAALGGLALGRAWLARRGPAPETAA